ncbi:winged helix-turn-helix transcriptional regulator [Halorarum halobium]|uniref:winged helix-turn-helix transcriptional regulator n=1 Tax=Halorarum halobium TaxID=3075121 RepID=UPI003CCCC0D1
MRAATDALQELEDATGASPKVLSQRLSEFVDAGLVSRRSYDEIPPHVEYEPTEKASALDPAFQFLYAWAHRYDVESETTERS